MLQLNETDPRVMNATAPMLAKMADASNPNAPATIAAMPTAVPPPRRAPPVGAVILTVAQWGKRRLNLCQSDSCVPSAASGAADRRICG